MKYFEEQENNKEAKNNPDFEEINILISSDSNVIMEINDNIKKISNLESYINLKNQITLMKKELQNLALMIGEKIEMGDLTNNLAKLLFNKLSFLNGNIEKLEFSINSINQSELIIQNHKHISENDPIEENIRKSTKIQESIWKETDMSNQDLSEEDLLSALQATHELNQLQEQMNPIIHEQGQKINEIHENVIQTETNLKVGGDLNADTALQKYNGPTGWRNQIIAVSGLTGSALGTVVPGLGNLIGAAIGLAIGRGISLLLKHKLKKLNRRNSLKKSQELP